MTKKLIGSGAALLLCFCLLSGLGTAALAAPSVGTEGTFAANEASTQVYLEAIPIEIGAKTSDFTIAEGQSQQLQVKMKYPGQYSYVWERSPDGGQTWEPLASGTADIQDTGNDMITYNIASADANVPSTTPWQYRITVTAGNTSSTSGIINVTVSEVYYTISISSGSNGTTDPSGDVKVRLGGSLKIEFKPRTGYAVDKVLLDGVEIKATSSWTMTNVTQDHVLKVSFKKLPDDASPGTGDDSNIALYTVLAAGSIAAVGGIWFCMRRHKKNDEAE